MIVRYVEVGGGLCAEKLVTASLWNGWDYSIDVRTVYSGKGEALHAQAYNGAQIKLPTHCSRYTPAELEIKSGKSFV